MYMDESQKPYAEQKKSHTGLYTMWFFDLTCYSRTSKTNL